MEAKFYMRLASPGLIVRYGPKEAVLPEPVTLLTGPQGDTGEAGPAGPPGPQGDVGTLPDVQDLTLLFENALV